eukprot:CAMPEP_0184492444 /NCGR_PEP_ID=MMETSP0113_2-20130426/23255_1 /TAXON_ID=91329 /ORGANISM="Norrisiella sphaerica, Strain BC52" /LENGTH=276 /DNA_ID=CAMNT_0026877243 /DNA_START=201 /DNA_END=1031 /DNA_ORIENTATION=-
MFLTTCRGYRRTFITYVVIFLGPFLPLAASGVSTRSLLSKPYSPLESRAARPHHVAPLSSYLGIRRSSRTGARRNTGANAHVPGRSSYQALVPAPASTILRSNQRKRTLSPAPRVNQNQNNEQEERVRQDIRNMIPGIIGTIGGGVTMIDQIFIAAYSCPPDWLTPQIERWGSVVVLATFFCTLLSKMITGKFLADFIEEGNDSSLTSSAASLYLRMAEFLSILAVVYSAGVTTVQVNRYGWSWDLQKKSDIICYEQKLDNDFIRNYPEYTGKEAE